MHEQMGYDESKMCVIPNGFLVDRFVPNPIYRSEVRDEIGLTEDAKVVGLVARFDPMKDHFSFIRAAGQILKGLPETRFVMCGEGISWDNTPLAKWIFDEGIQRAFTLLGPRDDLHRVYPAFDVYVSSSAFGEGFPNVLGEAMASGIPCVATDVGDSALIVGDTGRIVPPRNPGALAMALIDLLELSRFDLDRARQAARNRIVDLFTIQRIAPRFEAAYSEVIEDAGRADRERRMGGRH